MKGGKYIVFRLGTEKFGLPIENVEQVIESLPITRIPKTSKEVLGVFSLRGKTLPVIDARAVLGIPEGEFSCFIVLCADELRVAFSADRVDKIHDFGDDQVELLPESTAGEITRHVGRIDDRLVTLIEPIALIRTAARESLAIRTA